MGEAAAGASGAEVGAGRAERDYRHYHCREEGALPWPLLWRWPPRLLRASSLAGAQAARAAREAKALRKKENEQKGMSYQVVRLCSACACPPAALSGAPLADRASRAADHRHEEDQEDEQEAAQVDLEDGHNGRQAQGLHQEGEEGCGDGHNKVSADSDRCGTRFSVFGKSKVR